MPYNPNVYVLGGKTEIRIEVEGLDGTLITPVETRLSIKEPDGTIVTYSGGDLTAASGYSYYLYRYPTVGWYQYESWVKDANGREDVATRGFEVIDEVY